MERDKSGNKAKDSLKIDFGNLLTEFVIFAIAFLLLGVIASAIFLSNAPSPSWEYGEESAVLALQKNLSFESGETYTYLLSLGNQTQKVLISTKFRQWCPGVILEDKTSGGEICVRQSGFYSNSTEYLGGFSFPYYAPWMLYLHENFSWHVNRSVTVYPTNITQRSNLYFEVVNKSNFMGREAYFVRATELSSPNILPDDFFANTTYIVDAQKRVLLYAKSAQSSIIFDSAPFELEK